MHRGLDESRLAEWGRWLNHAAADVVPAQEAPRRDPLPANETRMWLEYTLTEEREDDDDNADRECLDSGGHLNDHD